MKKVFILAMALITVTLIACTDDGDTLDNSVSTLPTVSTDSVKDITNTTATGTGRVVSTGLSYVNARGICWSLQPTPTVDNNKTVNGAGIGKFTGAMTGLLSGMTYYVRAYATTPQGIAYGNEVQFKTTGVPTVVLPVVTTTTPSAITNAGCSGGGNVITDGGSPLTARGVCWSTTTGPTTANSKTSDGTSTGLFTSSVSGLAPATTYYIRAYASNILGTAYGEEKTFTTLP